MKSRRLLTRLRKFLKAGESLQAGERKAMHRLLADLKKKEHVLKRKIRDSDDRDQRAQLGQELAVCHAQRRKGMQRLRAIRKRG